MYKSWVGMVIWFVFASMCQVSKADSAIVIINRVVTPPPFPPTLPSLNASDSFVYYHYEITGTGYYDGDYGGGVCESFDLDLGLKTAVEEQTTHVSSNGTCSASSKSAAYDLHLEIPYCIHGPDPCPIQYTSNYFTCVSTTNVDCQARVIFPNGSGWDILPIYFYTNYDLGCGSLAIGATYSLTTYGKWGDCPPYIICSAKGCLYQLDLVLTPTKHTIPPIPSSFSSLNFIQGTGVSSYPGSDNSSTIASDGQFEVGGNFTISFSRPTNRWNLYNSIFASSDLINWENIGSVYVPRAATTFSFTDSNVSNHSQRFYFATDGITEPSGTYGFVKVTATTNGVIIANPLLSKNMTIGSLLTNLPSGTTLLSWGETDWNGTNIYKSAGWDNPHWELTPGNGLFICPKTNMILKFIGKVLQGNITNYIPVGKTIRSSALPLVGSLNALGLTNFSSGDRIQKRSGAGYITYTNIAGAWSPSVPILAAGEAIVVNCASNTSWSQAYQNLTDIDPNTLIPVALDVNYNDENDHTAGGYLYGYLLGSGTWGWVPDGSVCELWSVNVQDKLVTKAATSDFTSGEGEVDFYIPDDFTPGDQGDYVHLRYRNGNICGPWSNPLSNSILPY